MHLKIKKLSIFVFFLGCTVAQAKRECSLNYLAQHPRDAMACYLAEKDPVLPSWQLEQTIVDPTTQVTQQNYRFTSQQWPKTEDEKPMMWAHRLSIYHPKKINTSQALLFINGGTIYPQAAPAYNPVSHNLDFDKIAEQTHSIVVNLQDVPNQYLQFKENIPRKEDGIIAYTWNRYLNDPKSNVYWPIHVPMVKSVVRAMDVVQAIVAQQGFHKVDHFVLVGASKRGWVAWLTGLIDPRVNGIIPVVIDLLDVKANIQYIYQSHNQIWPLAFHDYIEQKVVNRVKTPEFNQLMQIVDPLTYLTCGAECKNYQQRLSMPKYIISASNDDFSVPDSLSLYLDRLPGKTQLRMIPNQGHYIDMKKVSEATLSYYKNFLAQTPTRTIQWKTNANGIIESLITRDIPKQVILWQAVNSKNRDFRSTSGVAYQPKLLVGNCQPQGCEYAVKLKTPKKGAISSFVEVSFEQPDGQMFVLTSPAYILSGKTVG